MLANLVLGLSTLLTPMNAVYMIIGTCLGIMAGAIPGLSATMAISLLVPVTFVMEPLSGLAMLAGIYNGGMFGGSISSILFNVPGAASAAVTAFDGHLGKAVTGSIPTCAASKPSRPDSSPLIIL